MKDEIKEIKIGMYTTDEILEFMTNGEGRGFMGRSMYDAIIDYITNLQEENEKVHKDFAELSERYFFTKSRNEKAIEYIKHYETIRGYYEYEENGYDEYNYDDDLKKDILELLEEVE